MSPHQLILPALVSQAIAQVRSGDTDGALKLLATASNEAQKNPIACNAFAFIYLTTERYRKSVAWFDKALRLSVAGPEAHAGKGLALQSLGRFREAICAYEEALKINKDDPVTLYNRGVALQTLGDHRRALHSYDLALAQRPHYLSALVRRSAVLEILGQLDAALTTTDDIFRIEPNHPESWCRRGNLLQRLDRPADAIPCYDKALALRPEFAAALINRAAALKVLQRLDEALADVTTALTLLPKDADAHLVRGNILQDLGREGEAQRAYRRALKVRPLIEYPAVKSPADFKALFIFSPLSGNTPYEDIISFANYESHVLMLLPGVDHDIAALRRRVDVVINLISDVDLAGASLYHVKQLMRDIGRPIVNAPDKILRTDRHTMSQILAGIEGCQVPPTTLHGGGLLVSLCERKETIHAFPLIARVAGTHGGECMELIEDEANLARFSTAYSQARIYLCPFVNYRSGDGFFRKYRFMFVGDDILPYHLAIGSHWKVHHASTDMAHHPWMQTEERAFIENHWAFFGPRSLEALRTIQKRVGLDYFGIDCGLTRDGSVVLFEVNASMLVHLRNEQFPYKNPAVLQIKTAFAALLQNKIIQSASHSSRRLHTGATATVGA
jgi:tetratricopeptide (TPR) repeat protein